MRQLYSCGDWAGVSHKAVLVAIVWLWKVFIVHHPLHTHLGITFINGLHHAHMCLK